MFGFGRAKPATQNEDTIAKLERRIRELRDELADLKQEKKNAEEDIRHMVRIREEQIAVENERKQLERDRATEKTIAEVRNEYRDKLEARLEGEIERINKMYSEILERLPKVTVEQNFTHTRTS